MRTGHAEHRGATAPELLALKTIAPLLDIASQCFTRQLTSACDCAVTGVVVAEFEYE
jgi:hypothetical protein